MNKLLGVCKAHWKWMLPVTLLLTTVLYFRYDIAEWTRKALGIVLPVNPRPIGVSTLQWCEHNYGEQVRQISEEMDLPYEYLMALAVLECSGEKPAGQRFEPHVFKELMKVKQGKRRKYQHVTQSDLEEMDEDEIRALATSWGPFQLMGYKVFEIDISIEDLSNDDDACYYGARWIKNEYGSFLKNSKWKDAFHIHNTGKRFPMNGRSQTHSPYYVSDGLKYMKYFSGN